MIQNLAPGFHEIERNVWYHPRADEFEPYKEDEEEVKRMEAQEKKFKHEGLEPLDKK